MLNPLRLSLISGLFFMSLVGRTNAQEVHLVVDFRSGLSDALLGFIDVSAGAIVQQDRIALNQITPTAPRARTVEWVGSEIWIGGAPGLYRYSAPPIAHIETSFLGAHVEHIVPLTAGGALLLTLDEAIEVDATGTEVGRVPFGRVLDMIPYQGGFVTIEQTSLRTYDANLQFLGVIGTNAAQLAAISDFGYSPDRLTALSNGDLIVSATVSIAVIDPAGIAQSVFNPGQFERDAIETPEGLVFIPAYLSDSLLNVRTGESFATPNSNPTTSHVLYSKSKRMLSSTSSGQGCGGSQNSVGPGAEISLIGTDDVLDQNLTVVGSGLPPGQMCITIYGMGSFNAPLGDGLLCISPSFPGLTRSKFEVSSFGGHVSTAMDFVTQNLGSTFMAGTTWHFQTVYRDHLPQGGGAGFNTTGSAFLTFRP